MDLIATLLELVEIPGPTGQEEPVMRWLRERWTGRAERIWSTKVGNLIAHVGGSGPTLLVQAHADEIGFVVRSIDEAGFLWLATAQVRDDPAKRYPIGQPALVIGRLGPVEGLIATATGHVLTEEQRAKRGLDYGEIFVDIGAGSREEVLERGIHVGAGVIWNPPLRRLGARLYGKAMDDRMLLALMTALIEDVPPGALAYDLYLAATIQEENGLIGANSIFTEVQADLAIALDVGLTGDIPLVGEKTMPTALGRGPLLVHKDASVHYDRALLWRLVDIAEREGIPVQHAIFERFGSDGAQFIRHGIPTVLLAPPTRYTHSPFEMVDERDLEYSRRLLAAFVTTPPE